MSMRAYVVGGAVRDSLLGLPVQDRDWVVVGASPEDMLAQGYRPVGKDFPVFLHPETHEEYALARTERKTAPGYRGFVFHTSPDVTLEQDLARRDLTINAIARADDGSLVDPFGGQRDLQARVFRHVSDAFAEDPVRILRVARFAARLPEFTVAPETNALMQRMVESGEADALVAERVWQELARGLMERAPARMFAVLHDCGALARILPELDARWGADLQSVPYQGATLPVRFATLMRGSSLASIERLCQRLKVPADCRDLAIMVAREQALACSVLAIGAEAVVTLFERCDAFRKPQRFADMLESLGCASAPLLAALATVRAVDAGAVARRCAAEPAAIPGAVHAARVSSLQQ